MVKLQTQPFTEFDGEVRYPVSVCVYRRAIGKGVSGGQRLAPSHKHLEKTSPKQQKDSIANAAAVSTTTLEGIIIR